MNFSGGPGGDFSTPKRKFSGRSRGEFYAVAHCDSPKAELHSSFNEAVKSIRAFNKERGTKSEGRISRVRNQEEADDFLHQVNALSLYDHPKAVDGYRCPIYSNPIVQDVTKFRESMKDIDDFLNTLDYNPLYIIDTSSDRPRYMHIGMRANVIHVAAQRGYNAVICEVLARIMNYEYMKQVYGIDTTLQATIDKLVDDLLNTPSAGRNYTPIGLASKAGKIDTVALLSSLPQCELPDLSTENFFNPASLIYMQPRDKVFCLACYIAVDDQLPPFLAVTTRNPVPTFSESEKRIYFHRLPASRVWQAYPPPSQAAFDGPKSIFDVDFNLALLIGPFPSEAEAIATFPDFACKIHHLDDAVELAKEKKLFVVDYQAKHLLYRFPTIPGITDHVDNVKDVFYTAPSSPV